MDIAEINYKYNKLMPRPLRTANLFKNVNVKIDEFFGSSPPAVFVGSKLKYPKVNVGILSPTEKVKDAWLYDAEKYWADNDYDIKDVIEFRSNLVNSKFMTGVKSSHKFLDITREIGMGIKDVDVEIKLKKKVSLEINFDRFHSPQGPRAPLLKAKIVDNVKVPKKIDKVVDDTDLKANDALLYLGKNFEEGQLVKLLSLGLLGVKASRKLVPTRWSITAVDDIIGKSIIKKIKECNFINEHRLFFGKFMGNYYLILLIPGPFSFDLFENYLPGSAWNPDWRLKTAHDYEDVFGRKGYAFNTAGGYYATRLAILEYLVGIKRQASALVLRFETPEYWASLGVWVVRNACRKILNVNYESFDDKNKALEKMKEIALNNLRIDVSNLIKDSKLIRNLNEQKRLFSYF